MAPAPLVATELVRGLGGGSLRASRPGPQPYQQAVHLTAKSPWGLDRASVPAGDDRWQGAPGYGTPILPVTFGPIVGNAQHLAVLGGASAALAPCGNVVGVHFGEPPYLALIGIMANGAELTI